MSERARTKRGRRRRCEVCGHLFRPNPKVGNRQYVCSKPECQRERHRRNCRAWREKQRPVVQAERFAKCALRRPLPPASPKSALARRSGRGAARAGPSPGNGASPGVQDCFNWELLQALFDVELVVVLKRLLTAALRGG